jgi:hypothetical protein
MCRTTVVQAGNSVIITSHPVVRVSIYIQILKEELVQRVSVLGSVAVGDLIVPATQMNWGFFN